jgi:glucose-6-phosphate isomerase, archaeal
MKVDLSGVAGFKLSLDTASVEIETGDGMVLRGVSRTAEQLAAVLLSPGAVEPRTELYRNYFIEEAPPLARQAMARLNLDFSLVLMPPGRVGREFVKTMGHYHPPIPGSGLEFPEVYTQFYGRLLLLLQKRRTGQPQEIEDCVLVEMTPGCVVTLPPGYAHVLINASSEPALMAGLYGSQRSLKPDYAPIMENRGMAYYVLDNGGEVTIKPNPNYSAAPPLRRLAESAGTPLAPVEPGAPLWASFLRQPGLYAFLSDAAAAKQRFNSGSSLPPGEG